MEKIRKFTREGFNLSKYKKRSADSEHSKTDSVNVNSNHSDFVTEFKEEKFSFTWRIENIHRCQLKCQEFFESPTFSTKFCGEVKWVIRIYPRGRKVSKNFEMNKTCAEINFFHDSFDCENVGIFLRKISTDPVNSSFRYRLSCERCFSNHATIVYSYPKEGEEEIKMDSTSSLDNGTDDLYCHDDFSFPETLIVTCNIYVTNIFHMGTTGDYATDSSKFCVLFQDLKEMYEKGKFSDVTLEAKNVKFPAHKAILASRSKVFDAMFQHDMKETQTNVVKIEDIEPPVLSDLLQYLYIGNVDAFNIEKAISLYPVADKYLLEELRNWCVNIMIANLSVNIVCQIAVLVNLHPDSKLKEAALNLFRKCTSEIFTKKEWEDLVGDTNHHALVSEILRTVSAVFITDFKDNAS